MQKTLFFVIFSFFSITSKAQVEEYSTYGVKGGMTLGFQKWNSTELGDVLLLPLGNGTIFTEIYSGRSALCIELGYHERGSGIIQRQFTYQDPNNPSGVVTFPARTLQRKFSNIVFQPAFKQLYDIGNGWSAYYLLGVRGEYTIKDTIPYTYNNQINVRSGLNRWNYGIMVGGGVERRLGKSPILMQVEFQAQPDFSTQIQSPELPYYDNYQRIYTTFPAQKVSNVTFELTLGFKFADYPDGEEE